MFPAAGCLKAGNYTNEIFPKPETEKNDFFLCRNSGLGRSTCTPENTIISKQSCFEIELIRKVINKNKK
jgi:hypothetical protein